MNSKRYAVIKNIFAEARERPQAERDAFLTKACAGDEALRAEIEELLVQDERQSSDAMDRALVGGEDFDTSVAQSRPKQIDKYRILGICGSGGMGIVYEAEQDTPHRRVALKVIQSGQLRPDLLRRFRRESEILGRLQHPGIAQIFDAGEFEEDGVTRPYFAMEFVEGQPLLAFATSRALSVAARLEIFVQVCDAIHYAHEHGVVHRDLKPDNIFVVEVTAPASAGASAGKPKVLDFGVSRLTDADAPLTVATDAGQLLGSVPYMSPEQAIGDVESIDARSDVYALGVVLFELLTGRLPHLLKQRALVDALHEIRHTEPTRLGSVDPALRGDLETIVGKCLEKTRERRYDSVALLREDLQRYAENKPITARPPTTWYQLQKFAQRNRALVVGAVTTLLALIGGVIVSVALTVQATASAELAERSAYRASLAAVSTLRDKNPGQARQLLDAIPESMRGWEWRHLSTSLSLLVLEFGDVVSNDMYLLANGARVIAQSTSKEFRIWEARTGTEVQSFAAPNDIAAWGVAHNGSLLAAALTDGRVVTTDPHAAEPQWATWCESTEITGEIDALQVDRTGERIAFVFAAQTVIRFGRPDAWQDVALPAARAGESNGPRLEFSPDGSRLAALLHGRGLYVWETANAQRTSHTKSTQVQWSMAWTEDGSRITCGHMRREIRSYDPATGTMDSDSELLGHGDAVHDIAYSRRGLMLSVSRDDTIRVWDIDRGDLAAILDARNTKKAEFLDDDHVLSLTGGRLQLWTLRDRQARNLTGHQAHVWSVVFSDDGGLLATSSPWGRELLVWDPLENEPLRKLDVNKVHRLGFDRQSENLRYHGLGNYTIPWTGGDRQKLDFQRMPMLHRWDAAGTGHLHAHGSKIPFQAKGLQAFRTQYGKHEGGVHARMYCDGQELVSEPSETRPDIGPNPSLFIGNYQYYSPYFRGAIAELLIFDGWLSDDTNRALDRYLTARREGDVAELPEQASAQLIAHSRADEQTVERAKIGKKTGVVGWVATNDARLRLEALGQPVDAIQLLPRKAGVPARVYFKGGFSRYRWLEMPFPQMTGKERVTVCMLGNYRKYLKNRMAAYSIGTADVPFAQPAHDERAKKGRSFSYSPDGRYAADCFTHYGGQVFVRDARTGYVVATFEGRYYGVTFHEDSRRLACGAHDGSVDVFDVETKVRLARIPAHTSQCFDVAFSPDGTRLASSGNDATLRIWDAETFEPLLALPGHKSYVTAVAWSPDSTMLASVSGDYSVRIWDSVSRVERSRARLANRALVDEASKQVETWLAESATRADVVTAIRKRWPDDAKRRRAALKALARLP